MAIALWNKSSYSKKLYLYLVGYSCLLMACFVTFQYHREKQFKANEVNMRLQIVNERIISELKDCKNSDTPDIDIPHNFNDLRVSIINSEGKVVYDNALDSLPASNHLSRKEIAQAIKKGIGFDIRRLSESTGCTYFYSAMKGDGYIVRTAIPYSVTLNELLEADLGFIWTMLAITFAMCIVGFIATQRLGQTISRLNSFAKRAEQGETIFDTRPFPHNELGDISGNIVRLYTQLQQALADRDREHMSAMHEQQEKIRIKKQLTNNINHELKTPVASIQVCLETLIAHPELTNEKRTDFLQRCYAGTERLRRLLDDVALITRMDEGQNLIAVEHLNLADIIAETCSEMEPIANEKGFTINNTATEPMPVAGNQSLLGSVFRNLLDNAIAYSGGDTIEIHKEISAKDRIIITVADNGSGIPSVHLPHIFERFYRIDKGRSRRAGGTGLGLSIVKNAIAIHGGSITAENRSTGGLSMRITIPLKKQ